MSWQGVSLTLLMHDLILVGMWLSEGLVGPLVAVLQEKKSIRASPSHTRREKWD